MKATHFRTALIITLMVTALSTASAQTAATSTKRSTPPTPQEVANLMRTKVKPVLIASAGMYGAQLTHGTDGVYTLSFLLQTLDAAQQNVHYRLILRDPKGLKVYTETGSSTFTLYQDEFLSVSTTVSMPNGLPGTYAASVEALNSAGLPLAYSPLGEVTLSGKAEGLGTCTNKADTDKGMLTVTCSMLSYPKGATATVSILRDNESVLMGTASSPSVTSGSLVVTLALPKEGGFYTVRTALSQAGHQIGASRDGDLFVKGSHMSITTITIPSPYYEVGQVARIPVALSSFTMSTTTSYTYLGVLQDANGNSCAAVQKGDLKSFSSHVFEFPVTASCKFPQVTVTIFDKANAVVAKLTVATPAHAYKSLPTETASSAFNVGRMGLAIIITIILGLLYILVRRRTTPTAPMSETSAPVSPIQ